MKKIAVIFILLAMSGMSVFASSWAFSFLAGYDHQSCSERDNAANALGFTAGARGPLTPYLDFFGSATAHFGGKFKYSNVEYDDSKTGYKVHVGAIYNIPLRSDKLSAGVGVSVAFARSMASNGSGDSKIHYGFSNLGIGIHGVGTFALSENFQVIADANPDVYFINWNTEKKDNTTTSTRLSKLGFGFSLKLGVVYHL